MNIFKAFRDDNGESLQIFNIKKRSTVVYNNNNKKLSLDCKKDPDIKKRNTILGGRGFPKKSSRSSLPKEQRKQIKKYKNLDEEYIKKVLCIDEDVDYEHNHYKLEKEKNFNSRTSYDFFNNLSSVSNKNCSTSLKSFPQYVRKSESRQNCVSSFFNSSSTKNSIASINTPSKLRYADKESHNLSTNKKAITAFLQSEEVMNSDSENKPVLLPELNERRNMKRISINIQNTFRKSYDNFAKQIKKEDYDLKPKERMKILKHQILDGKEKVKDLLGSLRNQQTQNQHKLKEYITKLKINQIRSMKV
jgi:hypothetical protein